MSTIKPSEKRKLIATLRTALGSAETAMGGADLPGLFQAAEDLQRRLNDCGTHSWPWSARDERRETERGRLHRVADNLLDRMGDEIKRRRAEEAEDAQYDAHEIGSVINAERAAVGHSVDTDLARALTAAAVAVAHCTAEVVAMAESDGKGGFTIDAEDMHQLRALLGAWSRAGEALMQHIRKTAA